jgi:phospholipid/cholesterol/gamma-HCH transport system substrate-binding protein
MEKFIAQKLKLGIFVISGTVLFILGVYLLGSKQNMFGNTANIFAIFTNVNGLRNGNNVRFSGINVGTVKEMQIVSDTHIVVKISIQKDIMKYIKTDAFCTVSSDGLVGSMVINILPGNGSVLNLEAGDTLQSLHRIRTDEMLQTLSITNENAALLTNELLTLLNDINTGHGLVGKLIKDANLSKDVNEIVFHLKNTSKSSTASVVQLNKMLESLNKKDNLLGLINDTSSVSKVKNTITNVEKTSKELDNVIKHLDQTILNANQTIQNLKEGKGAVNYLSNDPELVTKIGHTLTNLDTTIMQINKASINLNENLEAIKHTWLLRGYFKKVEKQKSN